MYLLILETFLLSHSYFVLIRAHNLFSLYLFDMFIRWLILGVSLTGLRDCLIAGKILISGCVSQGMFREDWPVSWWAEWGRPPLNVGGHHLITWEPEESNKAEERQTVPLFPESGTSYFPWPWTSDLQAVVFGFWDLYQQPPGSSAFQH